MWLYIDTDEAWEIAGGFAPVDFIRSLGLVCRAGDQLVFGGYDTSDTARDTLIALGATEPKPSADITLNTDAYRLNRAQYPRGRAFALTYGPGLLEALAGLCVLPGGGGAHKDIFYDTFCAYRPGQPARPLIDFNHATSGGTLYLSDWVDPAAVQVLAKALGRTAERVRRLPGRDDFTGAND